MREGWQAIPKTESNGYGGIERIQKETVSLSQEGFPVSDGSHLSEVQQKSLGDLVSKIRLRHVVYAAMATAAMSTGGEMVKRFSGQDAHDEGGYVQQDLDAHVDQSSGSYIAETSVQPKVHGVEPIQTEADEQEVQETESQPEQEVANSEVYHAPEPEISVMRPRMRPDYVESVESSVYENIPIDSKEFLTAVETTRQFITMPQGVQVLNLQGEVVGFTPAGEVLGTMPSAGYVETGNVTDGFSSQWQEAVRTAASRELGVDASLLTLNSSVWVDLQNGSEKLGVYPESISAMVREFASQSVEGTDLNRLEYLRTNFTIPNGNMPDELMDALEGVILGIPGEESRFDDTVVSGAGARTAFQIMEATWEGMGYPPFSTYENNVPSYSLQVEAFGRHISNIYNEIHTAETSVKLNQIREYFNSDTDYYTYFLTPLIVNAYNTGGGTMRAAISAFIDSPDFSDMKGTTFEGYHVFDRLSQVAYASDEGVLANYQDWSRQYTISVMAYANMLNEEFAQQQYRIAQTD